MIYSVRGKITHKDTDFVVIECGGIGYACRTTLSTLSRLGSVDSECFLYTFLNVREDAVELFGFVSQQELNCFKLLLSVSGIGPKAALSILSDMTPEGFALNVATGDYKAFTKSKGIGAKSAQRIVLELKDKITNEQLSSTSIDISEISSAVSAGGNQGEAISALVVLGYSQSEAASAVAKLDPSLPVEELIKKALKKISESM